jgi:hypothetical protein
LARTRWPWAPTIPFHVCTTMPTSSDRFSILNV